MGITISGASAQNDAGGTAAAAPISTTLQASVQAAQSASVEALFGSVGLGLKVNTTA
jgi:hypothetical protein